MSHINFTIHTDRYFHKQEIVMITEGVSHNIWPFATSQNLTQLNFSQEYIIKLWAGDRPLNMMPVN